MTTLKSKIDTWLEPSWPLMILAAIAIIGYLCWLMVRHEPGLMAASLAWLIAP